MVWYPVNDQRANEADVDDDAELDAELDAVFAEYKVWWDSFTQEEKRVYLMDESRINRLNEMYPGAYDDFVAEEHDQFVADEEVVARNNWWNGLTPEQKDHARQNFREDALDEDYEIMAIAFAHMNNFVRDNVQNNEPLNDDVVPNVVPEPVDDDVVVVHEQNPNQDGEDEKRLE